MPTIQYTAQLDFTDNGTFETGWRIKQGDFGDCEIVFRVVNNGVNMYDASVTPEIVFRRADGASVISNMTPNDGTYKYTFVGNELAVPGLTLVDVKYTDSEGRISTASCRFTVVEDTIGYDPTGAHTYDNPVSELVETATVAAETAIDSSFKAEGFAVGEQGGVPVEEGSPYYHNNAKYYGLKNAEDIEDNKQSGYLKNKNLLSGLENGTWTPSTQTKAGAAKRARSLVLIPVNPSGEYTISATALGGKTLNCDVDMFEGLGSNKYISSSGWKTLPYTFTAAANATYIVILFKTSDESDNPEKYISNAQLEKGSTATAYMQYAPSNIELANSKSDITAIGTDETGRTTASKAYAIGEHFYKDGKFCTAKTAIASGATFTLGTNYEESNVASVLDGKSTNQLTADSGGTLSSQACVTLGHIFIAVYIITANASASVVSGFPTLITQSNAPTALIRNLSNGQVMTANNYIVGGKHTMTGLTSGTSYTVTIIGII